MEEVLILANENGKQNDIESSRDLSTSVEARKVFVREYKRLLHPNVWSELGGNEKAAFQLVDKSGKMLRRQLNNHTGNIADNIRNSIVGTGALLGLSELQWKAMVDGFLKEETRG